MSYLTPAWPAPKQVKSIITTKKTMGIPQAHPRSDPAYYVALTRLLLLPTEPIWLTQTHSNKVVLATDDNRHMEADASIANNPLQIAVVFTADCLPIFVCNKAGNKVAAIHAGWRGLLYGIIANSVKLMNEIPENLLIYLGPAIGPQQFEVGFDVYNAFVTHQPNYAQAFTVKQPNKWLANIYGLATMQLNELGIKSTQIFGGEHCTVTEDDLFYSYRRDHGQTGRIANLIWFE